MGLGPVTVNFIALGIGFPVVAFVNPYATQFAKKAFLPLLKQLPNYNDNYVRYAACGLAGLVGLVYLLVSHLQVHSAADVLLTFGTLVGYAAGGGPVSMMAYGFLNDYLHQTPPLLPPDKVTASPMKVGLVEDVKKMGASPQGSVAPLTPVTQQEPRVPY